MFLQHKIKSPKKTRNRVTRLAVEIVVRKNSVIERAVWNNRAATILGSEKKITDQENMVNFLLQYPIVFEYLSRLL